MCRVIESVTVWSSLEEMDTYQSLLADKLQSIDTKRQELKTGIMESGEPYTAVDITFTDKSDAAQVFSFMKHWTKRKPVVQSDIVWHDADRETLEELQDQVVSGGVHKSG